MLQLKFKGIWRDYQKDVLDNLNQYLNDEKLHIVAAPGAGKTTLGIEVIARLKENVLILAPTLTIRNQWKERIMSAFMEQKQDIISMDIKNPKPITISTYQSLWAAFTGKKNLEESEDNDESDENLEEPTVETEQNTKNHAVQNKTAALVIKKLKELKISVLCLDEAHHLKNEWWNALDKLIQALHPAHTISLTATPPYDVSENEWKRYEELCGPIDDFISIPSLVKNGDLCPHQDYVYISPLNPDEKEKIVVFENNVRHVFETLMNDSIFQEHILSLDICHTPQKYEEQIFENPDFFIALLSYLSQTGHVAPEVFLKMFEIKQTDIPVFDIYQTEQFLNGLIGQYRALFHEIEPDIKKLEKMLRQMNIIHQRKVYLSDNPVLKKEIASSVNKMESVIEIIKSEESVLKDKLRMVILADFIRKGEEARHLLGVVPIFFKIVDTFPQLPIAILTGSLVVIPQNLQSVLLDKMKSEELKEKDIQFTSFQHSDTFIKLNFSVSSKNKIVKIITALFEEGVFHIIVGTQALLGEGWDAPGINSLILSSTISSYVSTNQMRGRAIRIDKKNPDKVANIWHLASYVHLTPWNDLQDYIQKVKNKIPVAKDQFNRASIRSDHFDIEQLKHRFEGFEAPTLSEPYIIRNGFDRMGISDISTKNLTEINTRMLELSQNRDLVRKAWQASLDTDNKKIKGRIFQGFSTNAGIKPFVFQGTFSALLFIYGFFAYQVYYAIARFNFELAIGAAIIVVLYFLGVPFIKYIRNGSIAGSMQSVMKIVYETLLYMEAIKKPKKPVKFIAKKTTTGAVFCTVDGLSNKDSLLVLKVAQEIVNPIENPRYVLVRYTRLFQFLLQADYHAVPEIIGVNKQYANFFLARWKFYIGSAEIVFTRSLEGRRFMLKARKQAFSAVFRDKTKPISQWG